MKYNVTISFIHHSNYRRPYISFEWSQEQVSEFKRALLDSYEVIFFQLPYSEKYQSDEFINLRNVFSFSYRRSDIKPNEIEDD